MVISRANLVCRAYSACLGTQGGVRALVAPGWRGRSCGKGHTLWDQGAVLGHQRSAVLCCLTRCSINFIRCGTLKSGFASGTPLLTHVGVESLNATDWSSVDIWACETRRALYAFIRIRIGEPASCAGRSRRIRFATRLASLWLCKARRAGYLSHCRQRAVKIYRAGLASSCTYY